MVCLLGESWLLPMYPETEKIVPPKRCTQGGMMTLANRSLGFFQLVSMKMVNSSDFLKWHFILKITYGFCEWMLFVWNYVWKRGSISLLGVSPNFEITVACGLKFHGYLKTLSLKIQKARTKIEVFLTLPCWLFHLNWESQQGETGKLCF